MGPSLQSYGNRKVADKNFQILQSSEHGERDFLNVQTGTTAILTARSPTQKAPWSATRVRNGSLVCQPVCRRGLNSLQYPGEPYSHKLSSGACASVKVWSGEGISHRLARTYVSLILRYSWSAVFLFVYTGHIKFAPLGSQGVASPETRETQDDNSPDERNPPQDSRQFGIPLSNVALAGPCSPTSVYYLEEKV